MSPVSGFITLFLARKGDGGMVETVVGHRRYRSGAEVLRQSPSPPTGGEDRGEAAGPPSAAAVGELERAAWVRGRALVLTGVWGANTIGATATE